MVSKNNQEPWLDSVQEAAQKSRKVHNIKTGKHGRKRRYNMSNKNKKKEE